MKKVLTIICFVIIAVITFLLCYDYNKTIIPNEYYQIYLKDELLGTIKSKNELYRYIDEKTSHVINEKLVTKTLLIYDLDGNEIEETKKTIEKAQTKEYINEDGVDKVIVTYFDGDYIEDVYSPAQLSVKKIATFSKKVDLVSDIYNKIQEKDPFTIRGYRFTIKGENEKYIYVLDPKVFEEAVKELIETYVGEEKYEEYLNETQNEIATVGEIIENVYIDEEISSSEVMIPVDEIIYTNYTDLAKYLLYGNNENVKTYKVKAGEMIEDIAFKNEISVKEFLISNPFYKTKESLIKEGEEVLIRETDSQLNVVVESYKVEDMVNKYQTVYQYDETQTVNYYRVIQEGSDGLERVSQKIKSVNGDIVFIDPKGKEQIKNSVNKIIIKGSKRINSIGDLTNWGWPSESGWTITSDYGWRIHPITGLRQMHPGIDIAGTGYGSKIYATNNGTIVIKAYRNDYGYYIAIDHHNGYYTNHAHLSKFAEGLNIGDVVERGQVIGYVGSTGSSTGPHIHFEVWKNTMFNTINPWTIYR